MAIETISLRKLLQFMGADDRLQTRLLKRDVASTRRREQSPGSSDGGDFHIPFWADAKNHAAGLIELREATAGRISANPRRGRLYPQLSEGFLAWWEERRRRRNEPFLIEEKHIKGRLILEGLGTVKIENNLAFSIGDDGYRVIYPYFCEDPDLSAEIARLGLWAINQAFPNYRLEDLRVLDVLRGVSFSPAEAPLNGTEEADFRKRYQHLLEAWTKLKANE